MKILLTSVAGSVIGRCGRIFPKKAAECKVICIPTAANVYETKDWFYNELDAFRDAGYTLDMLDIESVPDHEMAKQLAQADIIYVTGGNTFYLLEKMKACEFENHVRKALKRGAVYIGSSAGTIVCCPDIDYVSTMDDRSVANLGSTEGLNLVDFFVMVHMDHASFAQKANDKLLEMKQGPLPVICLKDDQAVFVDGLSITLI